MVTVQGLWVQRLTKNVESVNTYERLTYAKTEPCFSC